MTDPAKLTLRLERDAIEKARKYARDRGTSLSKIVEDHFRELTMEEEEKWIQGLPPVTRSFLERPRGAEVDEEDYWHHLQKKHA